MATSSLQAVIMPLTAALGVAAVAVLGRNAYYFHALRFAKKAAWMTTTARPFSLDDKYKLEEGTIYLGGLHALVRLPLDQHRADRRAGLNTATFISGYRGSPLGGYDFELERQERLLKEHNVVFTSGLNEELAATAVFGSQMAANFPGFKYDGVLGMWYGKTPGVDRSGDAFKHANYSGVGRNGGVLALAGDDTAAKSSTLPGDSEIALYDALIPTLYPADVQDILDLGLHGFAMSRASGLWSAMKLLSQVADGAATVEVSPDRIRPIQPQPVLLDGRPYSPQSDIYLLGARAVEMEHTLHYARMELVRSYARENNLNRITVATPDAWLGIVAAGKTYMDLRQALRDLGLDDDALRRHGIRLLKIGMLFPLEQSIVREFARGLREVLVVEEKRSFLETFIKDALYSLAERPAVYGKRDEKDEWLVPGYGELDADLVARAVARRLMHQLDIPSVRERLRFLDGAGKRSLMLTTLARPSYFCSGCPHNTSTLLPDGSLVGGGIGCHSLVLSMDRDTVGLTQMGGEGAQWIGMSPFTEVDHLFQNLGDGTLFHSGALAIDFAIASGVNITYKILFNGSVAMTGGQAAVGELSIPALSRRLLAEGVKRIIITTEDMRDYAGVELQPGVDVWPREKIVQAQETLAGIKGVTVLIHDQECAAEKRRQRRRGKVPEPTTRIFINERVCEGCGDCGVKSNCLSVEPIETEFGRKTMIHQSSCNQDYTCLQGDCPAFISVEVEDFAKRRSQVVFPDIELEEPVCKVNSDGFVVHMAGIGGTGVVTANQVLATAAVLDGKRVRSLDQTGLSQKGGPVVSSLKLWDHYADAAGKAAAGESDLLLAFDLLVSTDPDNLARASSARTIAAVSTSQVATGTMVRDTRVRYPALDGLLQAVEEVSRAEDNVYIDAQAIAEKLLGDHMPANIVLLGAAYQAGAVPVSADAIEEALRLNGVALDANLAAFRWGRVAVSAPEVLQKALHVADPASTIQPAEPKGKAARMVQSVSGEAELERLLKVRVPDLIAYQDGAYARRYVEFVRKVRQAESSAMPGKSDLSEAVARYLYKLMAYKDEYEVARLHLDAAPRRLLKQTFKGRFRYSWLLHPPLIRALGVKHKIKFGGWFRPGFWALRAAKPLRRTPLDPFRYTKVRRTERALVREYRALIESLLPRLRAENYETVVKIACLPDEVRGYESIKLANVARYRLQIKILLASLE